MDVTLIWTEPSWTWSTIERKPFVQPGWDRLAPDIQVPGCNNGDAQGERRHQLSWMQSNGWWSRAQIFLSVRPSLWPNPSLSHCAWTVRTRWSPRRLERGDRRKCLSRCGFPPRRRVNALGPRASFEPAAPNPSTRPALSRYPMHQAARWLWPRVLRNESFFGGAAHLARVWFSSMGSRSTVSKRGSC